MKKYIAIVLGALTIVGAFYFWKDEKIAVDKKTIPKKVISENRKLFLGKRKQQALPKTVSTPTCDSLLEQLNELDFSEDIALMKDQIDALTFENCQDSNAIEKIQLVKTTCRKKNETCQAELLMLRALLRTRGVKSSADKEMIADLILGEFAKKIPDFKKLEKLVNELLNQNPENLTYQKLWAMNKLLANIEKKPLPSGLQDEIYSRLDPEVLNNPELMSFRLYLETGLDPFKAEAFARSAMEQFPNRSEAFEALGWSLWQQNRRPEALAQVEKALALNPKDQWLKDMYLQLKAPGADLKTYRGRMNIGVRFEDLYQ